MKLCYNCGNIYYAGHLNEYKVKGKACFKCGNRDHFAAVRRIRESNQSHIPESRVNHSNAINQRHSNADFSNDDSYVFVVFQCVEKEMATPNQGVNPYQLLVKRLMLE